MSEILETIRTLRAAYQARLEVCPEHDESQRAYLRAMIAQSFEDEARHAFVAEVETAGGGREFVRGAVRVVMVGEYLRVDEARPASDYAPRCTVEHWFKGARLIAKHES